MKASQLDQLCDGSWRGAVYDVRRVRPYRCTRRTAAPSSWRIARVRETEFAVMVELEFSEARISTGSCSPTVVCAVSRGAMDDDRLRPLVDSGLLPASSGSPGVPTIEPRCQPPPHRFWNAFDPGRAASSCGRSAIRRSSSLRDRALLRAPPSRRGPGRLGRDPPPRGHHRGPAVEPLLLLLRGSADLIALSARAVAAIAASARIVEQMVVSAATRTCASCRRRRFDDRSAELATTTVLHQLERLDLTFTNAQELDVAVAADRTSWPPMRRTTTSWRPRFFVRRDSGTRLGHDLARLVRLRLRPRLQNVQRIQGPAVNGKAAS